MKKEKIKTDFVTMSRKAKDSLPSDLTKLQLIFKKTFLFLENDCLDKEKI